MIFNQFEEFGNAAWHYHVTGAVVDEIFDRIAGPSDRLAAFVSATGSAGTLDVSQKQIVMVDRWAAPNLFFGGVHLVERRGANFVAVGDARRGGVGAVV